MRASGFNFQFSGKGLNSTPALKLVNHHTLEELNAGLGCWRVRNLLEKSALSGTRGPQSSQRQPAPFYPPFPRPLPLLPGISLGSSTKGGGWAKLEAAFGASGGRGRGLRRVFL